VIDWFRNLFEPSEATQADPSVSESSLDVDMDALSKALGCPISNNDLYRQALRHRSLLRGKPNAHLYSNERLEYLGDAVVGFLVAEHLYATYPEHDEGFLTRLRAKLVNGRALAERAREIDLASFMLVSDSLNNEQRDSNSILADAFEAIIGALYLDQGMEITRAFVERTVLSHMDLDQLAKVRDNFKSMLLETVQARSQMQPEYSVISESGPSHDKRFVVAVLINSEEYGRGEGRSKKDAEQKAANQALKRLVQS
jgi:ribonuclease-3